MIKIWTTAPQAYDYAATVEKGSVKTNELSMLRGKVLRLVYVESGEGEERDQSLAQYQIGRYQSGLHFTTTDFDEACRFRCYPMWDNKD